jgi:hypothetical protein
MRGGAVILAAAIVMAPLGARGADLVVWWERAQYDEEDQAVREIVAAFEQETGKEVDPKLGPQEELVADLMAALEAADGRRAAERRTGMAHPVYDDLPEGSPAVGIATVLAPAKLPDGPRPVITWIHGTTGVLQKCMPSLMTAPLARPLHRHPGVRRDHRPRLGRPTTRFPAWMVRTPT